MSEIKVRRAKRQSLVGAIALIGPSGSGKTLGSLLLAYGMMKAKYPELSDYDLWGKIALIDTEHERSLVYEGMVHQEVKIGEFLFIEMNAPYDVPRYDDAVRLAKEAGAEVVIVDSTTHAWESEGGLMELQQSYGGRFQDWLKTNKDYRAFVALVTGEKYRVHTISTIRAKQDYAMEPDELGKMQVKKLGLKPVQRDSLEYEYQVVFQVDMESKSRMSKDNSGLFSSQGAFTIKPEHGELLYKWLDAGEDIIGEQEKERQILLTNINGLIEKFGDPVKEVVSGIEKHPSINSPVEHMSLEWLEKTYGMVRAKAAEIYRAQQAEKADEVIEGNATEDVNRMDGTDIPNAVSP